MKLRLIVKLAELILGDVYSDENPRADMCLPVKVFALALVLLIAGAAAVVYAIVSASVKAILISVLCLVLGVGALLCWKNQTIRILTDDKFEYTTFLGNKKEYRFSDITGKRKNNDSLTLFVGGGKVHIESSALMTEQLKQKLIEALSKDGETPAESK